MSPKWTHLGLSVVLGRALIRKFSMHLREVDRIGERHLIDRFLRGHDVGQMR